MRLTYIIGTRGRPRQLLETVRQTVSGMTRSDTRVLICADADDAPTIAAIDRLPYDDRIVTSVREREDTRGQKYARALDEFPSDLYAVGHDAMPVLTPGWDQAFVNGASLFDDRLVVVCSKMANASFPAIQAVTKEWVDLVGYIYNPDYPFWFIDHELDDIARMTGRVVYVDVDCSIAPMRPSKTLRLRDLRFWIDYFDAAVYRRRALARKIINAMDATEPYKAMLRTWFHPVECRTQYIHGHLKQVAHIVEFGDEANEARGEGGEPDAGYLRAFEHARKELVKMQQEARSLLTQEAA